jgi:5-methylcytosine-specific restriction protein A
MPNIPKKQKQRPWATPEPHGRRKEKNRDVYNTTRWRKFRRMRLNEEPLCRECEKKGLTVIADVLDHITPINEGGHIYSTKNTQPLCHPCHNSKSGKEAHKNKEND